jgi:DNA polymerase III subunit alpha
MKSASLHHHTTFSYLDGFGTPEQHVARAVELGMPALAVTEHGNVSSHVRHEKACLAAGVKPLFGVEAYTASNSEQRFKWHLTILAQNEIGYQNLLRLVSKGWENFYYEPTILGPDLAQHADGLVVLSGCSGSLLACQLLGGKGIELGDFRAGVTTARRFKELLGDRYYLEVQAFPQLERTRHLNQALEAVGRAVGIPLVATQDVHYMRPEQSEIQLLLHGIGRGGGVKRSLEDMARSWGYDVKLTFNTDRELFDKVRATGLSLSAAREACRNTAEVAERCTVRLPQLRELQYPSEEGSSATFDRWLREGWAYRGIDTRSDRREYVRRVRREVELIRDKGFVDYFLVIADLVKYAKDSGIPVGPARGSAAASLVCYLLRITEVDPIPFPNLLFERFIDVNRHDLPDVDLDFDDELRPRLREYLVQKYGEERVGNIGTFVRFRGRNALDDVARVHQVPKYELEAFKDLLVERSSGDLRGSSTVQDTVAMFPQAQEIFERWPVLYDAMKLEGNLRGMSVHAAGLVVANEPLTNTCAVYVRQDRKNGERLGVVSLDKWDAEYLNVLKIDALGLTTMGMIRICLELVGMTLEELYAVPLDDVETLRGFQENDVVGVFQFDGRAMRSVNREVRPGSFGEVADVNALARPGPLHSGATSQYIMTKWGKIPREELHPIVSAITAHTQGQIVYQEQILQVCRQLANFSWEEAARIRKIISKKRGEQEFNTQQERFMQGAVANGVGEATAARIWKYLVTAGAYAFNAAHCVSYGMLAFWTMWLKRHHPLAFYTAALRKYDDKRAQLLRDATKKGIRIYSPHANLSGITWEIEREGIRAGLTQIHGIGARAAAELVRDRPAEGWRRPSEILAARPKGAAYNSRSVAALNAVRHDRDPFGLDLLRTSLDQVRSRLRTSAVLGDDDDPLPSPTHTSEEVPYEPSFERVIWLGVLRERNLKDLFELHRSRTGQELDPATVDRPDLVNWVVFLGEDDTDVLTLTISRKSYPRLRTRAWYVRLNKDLVLVKGVTTRQYRRAIYVTDMFVFRQEG